MTAPRGHSTRTVGRQRIPGVAAVGLAAVLALSASACSSGPSSSAPSGTSITVYPPDAELQGCTYETDGSVPAGQPQGLKPPFGSFTPNEAAEAALTDIQKHGGTGLVNGFTIPSGAELFAGPDRGAAPVATVDDGRSLLFSDPVYWKTSSGEEWLASFVACGGQHLYWVSLSQVTAVDPSAGAGLSAGVKDLLDNPPYTKTGEISALPIRLDGQHSLVWATGDLQFAVARGEYVDY